MQNYIRTLPKILKNYKKLLIVIKGSPDPDALAASYAMSVLCETYNIKTSVIATTELSLERNKEFVKLFSIPLEVKTSLPNPDQYDGYIITDYQSPDIDTLINKLPCIIHIDHHEKIDSTTKPKFQIVDTQSGSSCTIITSILQELQPVIPDEVKARLFTSLLYGIHTDTDKYEHASKKDYDAIKFLTPHIDKEKFNQVTGLIINEEILKSLSYAINNHTMYKDWFIAGLNYVTSAKRDHIAITADYLLKREKVDTVVVFAVIVDDEKKTLTIDASIRTKKEYTNLNEVIKSITSNGGGRKFKGAFQVSIDYFYWYEDREALWEIVNATTIDIIKKRRDKVYIHDLVGFYNNFSRKIKDFLHLKN